MIDIRIRKDISQKLELEKTFNKSTKSTKPDKVIKDPSPKTIKRNISRDNFMKFQWPWII